MARRAPAVYRGPYRVDPQPPLLLNGEKLIVDLFAGGGGASTGMEWALGRSPDIAVNHDPEAVALHQVNHPHTKHFCESVFDVVPQVVCDGRPVGDLWMSPDCKHFSKAKGGKPVSRRVRGLAWVGKRWAATVRPERIYLENVEEFQAWGPLVRNGSGELVPCKKRAGRTFRNFVRELRRLGYVVDWRELRACDVGAPTIRKRLFLVARCDGKPILWPGAIFGDPKIAAVKSGQLLPWRTAAECIDWSLPCHSIFLSKEEGKRVGVRRPLVENTMRRVAKGVDRYVINSDDPFIVPAPRKGAKVIAMPSLTEHANGSTQRTFRVDEPLRTQCANVKGGHFALQSAMLLKHFGGVVGIPLTGPASTITTKDHHSLAVATMVQTGYGERKGQAPRALNLRRPLGVAVAGGVKHAVVAANIIRHFGESVGSSLADPLGTVMPDGMGKTGLVAACLARNFGNSDAASVQAPVGTATTKQTEALVTSSLVKMYGTSKHGQSVKGPLHTITANGKGGGHLAEVRAFLLKYYGAEQDGANLQAPMGTIRTHDCFGLVTVRGELYQIADIGMRMLSPRELYRAQGFPDSYIIDYVVDEAGRRKRLTSTAQVRMVGNSVSPFAACAIVAANTSGVESVAPLILAHVEAQMRLAA
jgi:DNA (cytosine-5)-methyltransferase 1